MNFEHETNDGNTTTFVARKGNRRCVGGVKIVGYNTKQPSFLATPSSVFGVEPAKFKTRQQAKKFIEKVASQHAANVSC